MSTHISADLCEVFDRLARRAGTDRSGLLRRLALDYISSEHKEMVALNDAFGDVSIGYLISAEARK